MKSPEEITGRLYGTLSFAALAITVGVLVGYCTGCGFSPAAAHDPNAPDAGDDGGPSSDGDARGSADAPPPIDAGPQPITLSETTSQTVSNGDGVWCSGSQTTRDNTWYRAFRLADYGISTTLHVSAIHFTSETSKGALVTVNVYGYTGAYGGATLDTAQLAQVASMAYAVPDSSSPQDLVAPIAVDIPSGMFVVAIAATDTQTSTGIKLTYFHLGANHAGETAPSYWKSGTCGVGTPTAQSGVDMILTVDGTH